MYGGDWEATSGTPAWVASNDCTAVTALVRDRNDVMDSHENWVGKGLPTNKRVPGPSYGGEYAQAADVCTPAGLAADIRGRRLAN